LAKRLRFFAEVYCLLSRWKRIQKALSDLLKLLISLLWLAENGKYLVYAPVKESELSLNPLKNSKQYFKKFSFRAVISAGNRLQRGLFIYFLESRLPAKFATKVSGKDS
jgi:hypothetical protein